MRNPQNSPRLAGRRMLASRTTTAVLVNRHTNVVARYCQPVACDVRTKTELYDVDEANRILSALPRRAGRPRVQVDA